MFKVLSRLRGLRTAADYAEMLPKLEQELETARETLAKLKARLRGSAYSDDAGDIDTLRRSIRESEDGIEVLLGAIEETTRRRDAADEAERRAEAEQVIGEARTHYAESAREWAKFDDAVVAIERLLTSIAERDAAIRKANGKVHRLGFEELSLHRVAAPVHHPSVIAQLRAMSRSGSYKTRPEPRTRADILASLGAGVSPPAFEP